MSLRPSSGFAPGGNPGGPGPIGSRAGGERVVGGRHLCILGATERFWVRRDDGQLEYIVNLLEPGDVRRVADAIRRIDRAEMMRGYEGIDPESFYALNVSEEDFEYTWDSFRSLRTFFERAAEAGRWVVFKADQ